jgi:hypothetical protein
MMEEFLNIIEHKLRYGYCWNLAFASRIRSHARGGDALIIGAGRPESKPELAPPVRGNSASTPRTVRIQRRILCQLRTTVAGKAAFMTPKLVREFVHPDDRQYVGEVCASSTRGSAAYRRHRLSPRDGASASSGMGHRKPRSSAGTARKSGVTRHHEYKLRSRNSARREQLSRRRQTRPPAPWKLSHKKAVRLPRRVLPSYAPPWPGSRFMTRNLCQGIRHPDDAAMVREVMRDTIQCPAFSAPLIRRDGAVRTHPRMRAP